MNDRAISLLENYDFTVNKTKKGRGAMIAETDRGLKLFAEYTGPKEKVDLQEALMNRTKAAGFLNIDCFVRNKEDSILSIDYDGKAYIVKDYYSAGECTVSDWEECKKAATSLAKLHKAMRGHLLEYPLSISKEAFATEFQKRDAELKRVRNFIRKTSRKSDFEILFLECFSHFEKQAEKAAGYLNEQTAEALCERIKKEGMFCHGDCSHHNILIEENNVFIINFEKFKQDIQVKDLALFLRKILEKNNWSGGLGLDMLNAYEQVLPFTKEEVRYIYARLIYPEKFWKIANGYLNQRKSLPSKRQKEKLEALLAGEEARREFLDLFEKTYQ
ncbi:MAG: CotS family spore coat protein [Lachnospiraceae bacterium]|nr:CotS family spore coat protein [Lachnospiraceae bacterium]